MSDLVHIDFNLQALSEKQKYKKNTYHIFYLHFESRHSNKQYAG